MSKVKGLKIVVRLLILATALFFIIGGPFPAWVKRVVPALSPFMILAESIAQRTWYAGLFWSLPPLVVLTLALFKGRFFCQWICPLGTLYSLPQKISLKKKIIPIRLNAMMFWSILCSSALGFSALLQFDPLSTVNRVGAWYEVATWIPGLLIPIFLILSFFQPQVWCTHLCPLGYLFDLANLKNTAKVFRRDRRQFIAGLGVGGAVATLIPRIGKGSEEKKPSVLPPGSTEKFSDTCTRCYACVSACPVGIIKVKKDGLLRELAMPELCFDVEGCEEYCQECTQVCPTGAIRKLNEEEKRHTRIGVAKVEREKCLAWTDNQYCMVCEEFCPYLAFETEWKGNVPCPVVTKELCRGCGACEHHCPATREGKAIFVHATHPQEVIEES